MGFADWIALNLAAAVNSAGIICDIVGAWFVGWEVVRQYEGKKYEVSAGFAMGDFVVGQQAKETEPYTAWEKSKYTKMKIGLALLTVGFALQLAANWVK